MAGKRRRSKRGRRARLEANGAPARKRSSRKKRVIIITIIVLLIAALVGAGVYFYFFDGKVLQNWLKIAAISGPDTPERLTLCPLDGTVVMDKSKIERRPLIVKVENLSEARPQSGLNEADIVIEAMAEGGITRFAVIYLCRDAERIGPVRSARQQDITFISEYNALFAHVGGSDTWGYEKPGDLADLDEFTYSDAYWRDDDKDAPHNVFTTTGRLHQAAAAEGLEMSVTIDSWPFKADKPAKAGAPGTATSVEVPYGADCATRYDYDPAVNRYLKSTAGEPFTDAESGKQIAPKNVIIMYVNYNSSDSGEEYGLGGTDTMELVGEGRAVILRDGEVIDGRWTKPSEAGRTMFLDAGGSPVSFNRGQTWIEIIPASWDVTVI